MGGGSLIRGIQRTSAFIQLPFDPLLSPSDILIPRHHNTLSNSRTPLRMCVGVNILVVLPLCFCKKSPTFFLYLVTISRPRSIRRRMKSLAMTWGKVSLDIRFSVSCQHVIWHLETCKVLETQCVHNSGNRRSENRVSNCD
jgi:hypothetical protein